MLPVRFPGPPSAPDVRLSSHPALHGLPLSSRDQGLCSAGPRCGDVARPPPIPSDRDGGGVEHDDPVLLRTVAWPAGQESPVEIRPRDPFVPFEQPLRDPVPGEGIEVAERCFRHAVTEIRTPSSEHRIEASEKISKTMMTCPLRQGPHLDSSSSTHFYTTISNGACNFATSLTLNMRGSLAQFERELDPENSAHARRHLTADRCSS